ncbi:MATE family efflux transporter [Schleiferilactobacillus shenzhenensis]|uniref:Multidrug export protein MepA n=1 Tax=Schleiferilactobacillus shenzhenensis LY-73 TaxID=1231336 RepID=U4TLL8_9LACO|nr:MATE family efflux transporter [Schleiferilactobacillus shenzhenensis]ERL65099.1 hypothetical protein L248_3037 [Schleiferilactobacillus shenzhenensis LY-73]
MSARANPLHTLFEEAPIPQAYFKLALPVVAGMVASMVYNLADTFFIAQTQDTNLVAGVALCTPLFSFLLAIGDIFGLGGSSLISRLLGEHDHATSARVSSFCLYGSIVVGLLTSVLLLLFENPILHLLGATAATYGNAAAFYRIMAIGAALIMVAIVQGNLIRTEGLATQSMLGTIAGTAVTIVLDPLLIFPLHMGAAGAATATVIGYGITSALLIRVTNRQGQVVTADIRKWHIGSTLVRAVLFIGIPASITNLMQAFGTTVLDRYLVRYGATQIAALGIVLKVYMLVTLIMVGFAFGAQPLIGYNYGARNTQRFKAIIRFDILVEAGYSVVLAGLLMLFAPQIMGLFMHDAAVITAGTYILRAFLLTTPFVGVVLVYTTVFQSAGLAASAFIMSIARQGVLFYLAILAGAAWFGYHGIIWAQPVADVATCVIGWYLYRQVLVTVRKA